MKSQVGKQQNRINKTNSCDFGKNRGSWKDVKLLEKFSLMGNKWKLGPHARMRAVANANRS